MGYVNAFREIFEQAASRSIQVDAVVFATGSGATHAGLLVGAKLLSPQTKVVGISVSETKETVARYVRTIAEPSLEILGESSEVQDEEIIVFEDYLKEGYGILNQEVAEAIRVVAETEGILLDPVYTGKAMTGFTDLVRKGYFDRGANVVFVHTGGTPALFPYREKLRSFLEK
jgi:1-aminocyclopropane-1-carboxylate deaminase/D-cysteine desulfhydrase-like pyridoxal-dependent ACC family enzyme